MSFNALYKGTRLIYGNPDSNVGIVTLWSKPKEMAERIDKNNYCVLGPLYSAERGLDLLLRNLLANPQITNLIVTGVDFSKSGIVLMDFFEKGFVLGKTDTTEKQVWRVNSNYEGYIDLDIPENDLNEIREHVKVFRVPDITNFDFTALDKSYRLRTAKTYIKAEETTKQYVGEYEGHVIRGKTVAECWLKILDRILKFGKESGTHYDDRQKEIMNLLSVITDENPDNLYIPDYLPSDRQHVTEYIPRITKDMPGGITKKEYTYGSRMRSWFGGDQVNAAIDKLAREHVSRAVVICLWDPFKDLTIGGSPCLNHIWLRVNEGKIHMTCIFRSHDMFEGYPENAFGLRCLQEEIRKGLEQRLIEKGEITQLKLGNLMILSQSAHIYDDCWERSQKTIDKYLTPYVGMLSHYDPRGNFVISIEDGKIIVEHTSNTKETLGIYNGRNADEIIAMIIKENIVSLVPHALDLGKELHKAEVALRLGKEYRQDAPLEL